MKVLVLKPQRPLGEKICQVIILEMETKDVCAFSINQAATGMRVKGKWSLDEAIGFCHENLIPIERIGLLKAQPEV